MDLRTFCLGSHHPFTVLEQNLDRYWTRTNSGHNPDSMANPWPNPGVGQTLDNYGIWTDSGLILDLMVYILIFHFLIHVLKVWGNWLGYPISFSTPSWPPSWAGWRPGLLEIILDGSTKNTPNQLARSTKLPLFKKYPKKSKYGNTIFSMLVGEL